MEVVLQVLSYIKFFLLEYSFRKVVLTSNWCISRLYCVARANNTLIEFTLTSGEYVSM